MNHTYLHPAITLRRMAKPITRLVLWCCLMVLCSSNILSQDPSFEEIQANKQAYPAKLVYESYMNKAGTLVMSDLDSAVEVYRELQTFCNENGHEQYESEAYQAIGESYYMSGEFDKAIGNFKNSLKLTKDPKIISQNNIRLGGCYSLKDLRDSSIHYYNIGIGAVFESKDTLNYPRSYVILGQRAFFDEKYITAVDHFQKALDFSQYSSNEALQKINALREMATVYASIDDFQKAIEYSTTALKLAEVQSYSRTASEMHKAIGVYQNDLGNYEQAEIHLRKAYPHFEKKKIHTFLVNIYAQLAYTLLKTNQIESAEAFLKKAKRSFDLVETERYKIGYYLSVGYLNLSKHNYRTAENSFNEALKRSIISSNYKNELESIKGLLDLSRAEGKTSRILEYSELYHQKKDSIQSLKQNKIIYDYEARYKKKEQEESIAELNIKNELQEIDIKQKQRQLYVSLLGLLALLSIIGLGVWAYRNKTKNEQSLQEKNQEITRALEANELLLKEIHHRVKNNLQIISSLLNLQGRQIEDPAAKEAIKAGQNRIKSMALIHQNLYQDEDVVGVNSTEYIENLITSLISSYNIGDEQVEVETHIDDIKMDVDTVIPIGLILNELISNSMKYGFDRNEPGLIKVSLKDREHDFILNVADTGSGLPDNFSPEKLNSLGFKIIKSFTQKLKGQLVIDSPESGTSISVLIPKESSTVQRL